MLGVNGQETQGSIDAALTFGILWLDACRIAKAGKFAVEGLKLFLPAGDSALTRERVAHLNQDAAKWQLYELEERDENLKELDTSDCGNVATRLVHSTDELAVEARFAVASGAGPRAYVQKPKSQRCRQAKLLSVAMAWNLRERASPISPDHSTAFRKWYSD